MQKYFEDRKFQDISKVLVDLFLEKLVRELKKTSSFFRWVLYDLYLVFRLGAEKLLTR